MLSLFSFVLLFTTLAAWRAGQKVWLLVDSIATMIFGASLLLTPNILLLYQTTVEIDPASIYLTRVVGLMLFSSSFVSHRAFVSKDRLDRYVIILSRTITALLFVIVSVYGRAHYPEWSDEFLHTTCIGALCWLLPNLFYAVSTVPLGRTESIQVSGFLITDFFLTVTSGFLWFGFPQGLLRMQIRLKPNSISVTISRFLGALLIGNAFNSILAACLCSLKTKQYLFSVKIITAMSLVLLIVFGHSWAQHFVGTHFVIGTAAAIIWGLNSAVGYMMIALTYVGYYEKKRRPLRPYYASQSVSASNIPNAALTFSKMPGDRFLRRASVESTMRR